MDAPQTPIRPFEFEGAKLGLRPVEKYQLDSAKLLATTFKHLAQFLLVGSLLLAYGLAEFAYEPFAPGFAKYVPAVLAGVLGTALALVFYGLYRTISLLLAIQNDIKDLRRDIDRRG
ncbi:MAG: hypothetical protein H6842_10645 [Rhodospirillaceae bacterium]|nr:hypothetical protein [Rhodospirillaceae bacterium]